MRDYRDAKAIAQTLRQALKERSVSLTHSESLELIARVLGVADWNTPSAKINASPKATAVEALAVRRPVLPLRDLALFPEMTTPMEEATTVAHELLRRFAVAAPLQALLQLPHLHDAGRIADTISQYLSLSIEQRQQVLEATDVVQRTRMILALLLPDRQAA